MSYQEMTPDSSCKSNGDPKGAAVCHCLLRGSFLAASDHNRVWDLRTNPVVGKTSGRPRKGSIRARWRFPAAGLRMESAPSSSWRSLDRALHSASQTRHLDDMVKERQFREDLWFRLNVFPIRIPSLREREILPHW